ncbi:PREDICTED: copper transporter 2-like isoform X2 [Tarenaya hassleriana]|uniref:copper transporter 2-like isoform X2 n=1 Tax=Tarenaya hassleriana TaxID=28532 RepID=UPI00053C873B|nr:PREDICTED: copper transporter 2-like isoform X2 [Tarenaya hassleriana]
MDHDHMHGMTPPPPSTSMMNNANGSSSSMMNHPHKMMMHMTFFWGTNTEVVFSGWPGTSSGMYALCIIVVFFAAVVTEWLAHSAALCRGGAVSRAAGLVQTAVYTLRTGLAYLVMLALMSFNGGVFLAAIAGHAVGFLVFGSRVFKDSGDRKIADLPPSGCAC